jgi:type I restriction enzyme, S subunit
MREVLVKNEEFKDSPLGKIPKDWDVVNLGSVLTLLYRYPTYYGIKYVEKGVPEIRGELILDDGKLEERFELYRYVSESTANRFHKVKLEPGDFVMSVRGTMGKVSVVPDALKGAVITANLIRIQFNQLLVLSQYARHFLSSDIFQNQLDLETSATTIKTIQVPVLSSIILRLPPIPEQQRIAEILDTVDEAIAHTSSLITKLKQTKAGLMQDLLTRGLDEDGKLRDPKAHPEQFKDSPLGRTPRDWDVFKLLEIVPHAEYGISVSLDDETGIPVLRMNNLKDGEVDLMELKKSASFEAANLLLQPFDVLFNRTNSIEHVGRTAIYRGQIEQASFASYLVRLVPEKSKLIPEYLNIWLNLPITQIAIRRYATPGVHQVNINPTNLRQVLIALPKEISEQEAIVANIASNNTRIRTEELYFNKLKLQKQGLMQDLLTGKVRAKNIK